MKKIFLVLLIILIIAAVVWLTWPVADEPTAVISDASQVLPISESEPAIVEETSEYDPVSLPALMEREFDGRDLQLGEVLAQNESYTRYYITYLSGDLVISGIMNIPRGEGSWPVLILNHGHIDTAVYTNGRGLKREQDYLARQGFAVLHPDYRNHAQSDDDPDNEYDLRLGYTVDVINAVYAVKNSSFDYLDKNKIGMLGHSMGGGITQNVLVVEPELVQAAILYAPVSLDARDSFHKWMERGERGEEIAERFGLPEENPGFWDNASAQTFVENITAPVQIHHGTRDESVPLAWSERSVEILENAGKDVELYVYENEPHEFINQWPLFMQRSAAFFKDQLRQ